MNNLNQPVGVDNPAIHIQKLIKEFEIPRKDALVECLLAVPGTSKSVFDSAIFLSTDQSKKFYTDIFQFWVRSFFCFIEDTRAGSSFREVIPFIQCQIVSPDEFRSNYFAILHQRCADQSFIERQAYPETYVELESRSFSNPYVVLTGPDIKSGVADSDGEYISYFQAFSGRSA